MNIFGLKSNNTFANKDLLIWAKTEYGADWIWAYNFMIANPGKAPTHTVGVTL